MKTVVTPGAFDTKGVDYEFLAQSIQSHGVSVLSVDFGVMGAPPFVPDVSSAEVALAGGVELASLRRASDKTLAMRVMAEGLSRILLRLYEERRLDGVCGMGGSGGTTILSAGVRGLPIGVPKLLISTVVSGDVSAYVGTSDVTLMHSVVDVAGLNRISRRIYSNAAGAVAGMVKAARTEALGDRPIVGASMFGNTTRCVDRVRASLERAGWEVLVFHATGIGGRTMQRLATEGLLAGLLDLTTTELADEVCGGIFSAGLDRLQIGAACEIPVVLAPGCVDMCNFGRRESVPQEYGSRLLYEWNENVTLLRTNVEENRRIGELIANTANRCRGPVAVMLPLRGVSMLDSAGQPFWDEAADRECFQAIRSHLNKGIPVIEVDANINDPIFADRASQIFLELSPHARTSQVSASRSHPPEAS